MGSAATYGLNLIAVAAMAGLGLALLPVPANECVAAFSKQACLGEHGRIPVLVVNPDAPYCAWNGGTCYQVSGQRARAEYEAWVAAGLMD